MSWSKIADHAEIDQNSSKFLLSKISRIYMYENLYKLRKEGVLSETALVYRTSVTAPTTERVKQHWVIKIQYSLSFIRRTNVSSAEKR